MKPYYVTTPIYYVNDKPHIGHAYSTVAADVLHRYQELRGRPSYFLTGLDEHGLKLERKAREEGLDPREFVDRMAPPFRRAWEVLRCANDDFIRTTEPRHEERAQRLWKRLHDGGDIYLGHYEDWYCVGCETYYPERELLEGNLCPTHKAPVERIKEASYFFRLSDYTEKLLDFYEANPTFVQPDARFNEVKSFVREGLRDLSISRTSFRWGVPVPDDPEHVMYVWLDALTNYISALGGPAEPGEAPLFDRFWPPSSDVIHIVGKDILRFHAVYWPAFLMSAGIEPPTQIWAHGWLTVNGDKMSKSLGNFLPPEPLVEAFGADVLRYYFMRDIVFGQDGDFSHRNLLARYHGELGNGLGNLLHRMVASIVKKSFGGKVPHAETAKLRDEDREVITAAEESAEAAARHLDNIAPQRALEAVFELVSVANRYVDRTEPWQLAKQGDDERLGQVCYTVLESLRWMSVMLWPFMPDKADGLRAQLGLPRLMPTEDLDRWPSVWGGLEAGTETQPGKPLFPRFDDKQEQAILERLGVAEKVTPPSSDEKAAGKAKPPKPEAKRHEVDDDGAGVITIDDVAKVDLRLGVVKVAEPVPKADKLLRLEVDIGEPGPRQVLAGIAQHYAPEDLIGKRVVVVANLAPRTMRGYESQGMILAASDDSTLAVLE
ncbi:MAG: methionine--tRNA ligase, partial [Polyangiales bacterium]